MPLPFLSYKQMNAANRGRVSARYAASRVYVHVRSDTHDPVQSGQPLARQRFQVHTPVRGSSSETGQVHNDHRFSKGGTRQPPDKQSASSIPVRSWAGSDWIHSISLSVRTLLSVLNCVTRRNICTARLVGTAAPFKTRACIPNAARLAPRSAARRTCAYAASDASRNASRPKPAVASTTCSG
jgi:hypothetical protein